MKIVLLTQNRSLQNLWQGYALAKDIKFVNSKRDFLSALNQEDPDIAIVDVATIKGSASEFMLEIFDFCAKLRILFIANEPKFAQGKALLTLGAKGYANSHMQEIHVNDAIKTIQEDKAWLYPEFIQEMITEMTSGQKNDLEVNESSLANLSEREKEMAQLIYEGLSNQKISEQTGITLRTVKAHTASIYNKLGVKDRIGLVLLMQKNS
ncbi:response regulator transcription factor [Campylobacter sp. RM13119]|uniref:helix-turn-helix transcriptional regulator n=1 Tax=Campylobacter TaxID=194 RepID=UPI00147671C5|nr:MULTISPECIES: response regulator transcription factor [unclassified Campylobacter]MBE3022408.1 response regulator transcription factor [Campylobacter sp. 7477a]MBE3606496.1 response regulator transcription factor [Campylobacter sp. RM13119]MBE3610103.1 response regulator transcription factor [Campylobacter sp. RM12916]